GLLQSKGLAPPDILAAVSSQNLVLPSGTAKIGQFEYDVDLNASPRTVAELNNLPVKVVGNSTIYVRDVAQVSDGFAPQINIVRHDGRRGTLMTVVKSGNASTIDVVKNIRQLFPRVASTLPPQLNIQPVVDQSIFVSAAVSGVIREAVIAACLTGLMILLFLGSWRSTLIIAVSIPLSILTSLMVLSALGQTINIMTLGGLALAVGILVDDSTVTIENTHRLLEHGDEFDAAVLEGAAGIALPTLISTLAICAVFVSVFFLQGAARYLFTPLAMAVVFAMLAFYGISRTLTPIIIRLLLRSEHVDHGGQRGGLGRFNAGFERFRDFYGWLLAGILRRRVLTPLVAGCVVAAAVVLSLFVGSDFFPEVDAGLIQLHVRVPARTRIERTEQIFHAIEENIRQQIPASNLGLVLDNIGLPSRGYNLAFTDGTAIGVNDGQILLRLKEGLAPTADYIKRLRQELPAAFPDVQFYFQPADLV